MLPVVVLVRLLPAVVIHEGVVGSLVEVDVIDPITLVVVSKQNTRMKKEGKLAPILPGEHNGSQESLLDLSLSVGTSHPQDIFHLEETT